MTALTDLLAEQSIVLDATATGADDAIAQAGAALIAAGAVDSEYTAAMLERERSVSTYVGEGVAVPHGTLASEAEVQRDALVLLRFADPIDWNGNDVTVVIGLAARGRGHVGLLSQLAAVLLEPERALALREATSTADVHRALSQ
ncbi:PTS sugar transporter subunit IIA [Conyzicola sp.]|uniref:PTS sugar transporter subunit IIA n=1 Tax=Conyzicola sp. TaxID=1969404 RepID=UPI0039897F9B